MLTTSLIIACAIAIPAIAIKDGQEKPKTEKSPLIKGYHQRLLVKDFAAEFRFFRDVLGVEPTFGTEKDNYADFEISKGKWFAIFSRKVMADAVHAGNKPAEAEAQDRSALIFFVKDVDAAFSELKKRGVVFITEPNDRKEWGIRVAHFRDPDGNLIEINGDLKVKQ